MCDRIAEKYNPFVLSAVQVQSTIGNKWKNMPTKLTKLHKSNVSNESNVLPL